MPEVITTQTAENLSSQPQGESAFSWGALTAATLASVAGTVLPAAFGAGKLGTLAGTALGPVIASVFTTRSRAGRGRVVAIVVLSAVALIVAVTGFTFADVVVGKSPIAHRNSTILPVPKTESSPSAAPTPTSASSTSPGGTDKSGPLIYVAKSLACGQSSVGSQVGCPVLTVTNNGSHPVTVTNIESPSGDFSVTNNGCDNTLSAGASCTIAVAFTPAAAGNRSAQLVIHQDLPDPPWTIQLSGIGLSTDTCATGYVWRDAFSGDHVCVLPEVRDQAARDNAAAASRVDPQGAYGPDSCVQGFVWREARPGDHVCVTGDIRQQTYTDNQAPTAHRQAP